MLLRGYAMKINKILSILLIITLMFSVVGCKKDKDDDYVEIEDGDGNEDKTEGDVIYCYTSKNQTLHRENCPYAKRIAAHELLTWDKDIITLVDDGYKFCGLCCPDEKLQYTDDDEHASGVDPSEATYVLNIKQKKIHELDCVHVEAMSPSNTEYTDLERDVILESGYALCQTCKP